MSSSSVEFLAGFLPVVIGGLLGWFFAKPILEFFGFLADKFSFTERSILTDKQKLSWCTVGFICLDEKDQTFLYVKKGSTVGELREAIEREYPSRYMKIESAKVMLSGKGDDLPEDYIIKSEMIFFFYLKCLKCNQYGHVSDRCIRGLIRPSKPTKTVMGYVYGLRSYNLPRDSILPVSFYSAQSAISEQTLRKSSLEIDRLVGGYGKDWNTTQQTAVCEPHIYDSFTAKNMREFPVPHPSPCKCGINMYYASKSKFAKLVISNRGYHSGFNESWIIALTKGWGRVVEHESGFRVEHAEIISLYVPSDITDSYEISFTKGLEGIEWTYDVNKFHRQIEEYGNQELITIPDSEGV